MKTSLLLLALVVLVVAPWETSAKKEKEQKIVKKFLKDGYIHYEELAVDKGHMTRTRRKIPCPGKYEYKEQLCECKLNKPPKNKNRGRGPPPVNEKISCIPLAFPKYNKDNDDENDENSGSSSSSELDSIDE